MQGCVKFEVEDAEDARLALRTSLFDAQRRPAAAQWPGELPADVEAAMAPRRWREDVRAARSASLALYSCAGSRRNRLLMRKDGVVPLLARLMHSDKPQLLVPVVGILNHFAKEVLISSFAVLDPAVGHTTDVLSPFISVPLSF